jgi:hypothetical protein
VDAQSKFEVCDITLPDALDWCNLHYDIVLLLGVYHKLKRAMSATALETLIEQLSERSRRFFAWNGHADEYTEVSGVLGHMKLVHWSLLTQQPTAMTAVWKRA